MLITSHGMLAGNPRDQRRDKYHSHLILYLIGYFSMSCRSTCYETRDFSGQTSDAGNSCEYGALEDYDRLCDGQVRGLIGPPFHHREGSTGLRHGELSYTAIHTIPTQLIEIGSRRSAPFCRRFSEAKPLSYGLAA